MVTFTLSQSVREFVKSRAICSMCISVVYVPTCQTSADFPFLRANVPINVPMCQRCNNDSTFQYNFSIFEFFNYAQYLRISRIFGQFQKTYHLRNFIKEKPCQPKTFDVAFNGARGINRTIIRLV